MRLLGSMVEEMAPNECGRAHITSFPIQIGTEKNRPEALGKGIGAAGSFLGAVETGTRERRLLAVAATSLVIPDAVAASSAEATPRSL